MNSIDPETFYDFEHRRWEEVARRYDHSWALVTQQAIEPLLNAALVNENTRVLDVACGPGYVAGAATARPLLDLIFLQKWSPKPARDIPLWTSEKGTLKSCHSPTRPSMPLS